MADGQRRFATQRAAYEANLVPYPRPPGQPPPIPMHNSESALSLTVSRPLPPHLQQRRGTVCTSEVVRVESNTMMPGHGHPPMAGHPMTGPPMTGPPMTGPPMTGPPMTGPPMTGPPMTGPPMTGPPMTGPPMTGPHMRRSYMVTSFAEPPSTIAAPGNFGPCPQYGRPYSPPPSPPPGARRSANGQRSPVRRPRRAYDEDDYDGGRRNGGCDDDDDDDLEYAERSRRQLSLARRSRSQKDAVGPAKSTMSRSGSRLRILRIEREISDTGSTRRGASSTATSRQDDAEAAGSCVCICGTSRTPPRTPSRGRLSGIYIKPRREPEAEELYVIKRIRDKKRRRKKKQPPPPAAPPQQRGLVGYICNLVGLANEEAPPPQVAATESDDEEEYELRRLDRAELERLCRQMGVTKGADEPEKK
ncbi:uncharacterized protein [Dermacentor andersoni]|uniref:uncharacterized protein n=1 Tax=Dermacentor andersoni TaxID=34620 RepID=UPI003B3A3520